MLGGSTAIIVGSIFGALTIVARIGDSLVAALGDDSTFEGE